MNPVALNCILLYVLVVILSLFQSKFKIYKDEPMIFLLCLILTPILVFAKAGKIGTWTGITGFEIFGWTLILAYMNPKRIVPRVNEGYIYAYTLFHWYLLVRTIEEKGFTYLLIFISLVSIYPTFLICKSSLEHKILNYRNKLTLYYWFLFTITFTYIEQVALDIIKPILAFYEVNLVNTIFILITALQLYFIATSFSLLFVGVPIFHLDKSVDSFSERWKRAKSDWRVTVSHKLGNYIEYQINKSQFILITLISGFLFMLDYEYDYRFLLILCYTVLFPLVFFYIKWTPEKNIEENSSGSNS